jgi:thiol-disulfide isomerase/thioredoxin
MGNNWLNELISKSKTQDLLKVLRIEFEKAAGTQEPEFVFRSLYHDTTQTLADFKKYIFLINFWTIRCSGCRYEMPVLSQLQNNFISKGLYVIFLSPQNK